MPIFLSLLLACGTGEEAGPKFDVTTMGVDVLANGTLPAETQSRVVGEEVWEVVVTYREYDAGTDDNGVGYTFLCTSEAACRETFTLYQRGGDVDLGTAGIYTAALLASSESGASGEWAVKGGGRTCAPSEKLITISWMAAQDGPTGPDGIEGEYAQDYFNSDFFACATLADGSVITASPDGQPCASCGWDEPWWSQNEVPEYPWLFSPGYRGSWGGRLRQANADVVDTGDWTDTAIDYQWTGIAVVDDTTWDGIERIRVLGVSGLLACEVTYDVTGTPWTGSACVDASGTACDFAFETYGTNAQITKGNHCDLFGLPGRDWGPAGYGYHSDWNSGVASYGPFFMYYYPGYFSYDWVPLSQYMNVITTADGSDVFYKLN